MGKAFLLVALAIGLSATAGGAVIHVPADEPTIQSAIEAAQPGDEVVVAAGEYFENIDLAGKAIAVRSFDPLDPLVVAETIINGGGTGPVVTCANDEGPLTVLAGLTITNGAGPSGGGMSISFSSPTVTDCVVTANANRGLRAFGGDPEITRCVFDGNTGGGAWVYGGYDGGPTFTDCTFSNNHAPEDGGGILLYGGGSLLVGCTFVGNTASAEGGGMMNLVGRPIAESCTFVGNAAGAGGGLAESYRGTWTDCAFTGNTAVLGGGVLTDDSGEFTGCTIAENSAMLGAGLYNDGGWPELIACSFVANEADWDGGGVYNIVGEPLLAECVLTGNIAEKGGGLYSVAGHPSLVDTLVSGNTAWESQGGGLYNLDGEATLTSCVFRENYVWGHGGGMYNEGSSLTIALCEFRGNLADGGFGGGFGAGMYNSSSDLAVVNSAFLENNTGWMTAGGGMYNLDSHVVAAACTFGNNRAMWAGASLLNLGTTEALITNCNLWGEYAWTIDSWEPAVTIVQYSNEQGGFPGAGNIDADPLFVDPANGDYRLQPDSPCIDAGHNLLVPDSVVTDLDGSPRFTGGPVADTGCGVPVIVDMGAYEFQGEPFPVKRGDLDGDGVIGVADFLELLEAWGPCGPGCCLADVDLDGSVGATDFLFLLANWG